MVADFQRARTAEQVAQRRAQILDATALLIDDEGLNAATLSRIGSRVGLAKSNIYRYFESREAIFVELFASDWGELAAEIEGRLEPLAGSNDAEGVAGVIASGFRRRPRLCSVNSVLSSELEHKMSEEAMAGLKARAAGLGLRVANGVHAALPRIALIRCIWAVGIIHAVAAGLWPAKASALGGTGSSKVEVFQDSEMDFAQELESAVCILLYGLLVEAARGWP
jgi:AcrR family transcriptional regulator